MEQGLFVITCTTCETRLTVRNDEVIGAILPCPKCGGLVQVVPPPGWHPGEAGVDDPSVGMTEGETPIADVDPTPLDKTPGRPESVTTTAAAAAAIPPPLPSCGTAGEAAEAEDPTVAAPARSGAVEPVVAWASPTELLWRKWLILAGGPVAGLVVVVGVLSVFFSGGPAEPPPVVDGPVAPARTEQGPTGQAPPDETPPGLDPRWLPEQSRLVFSMTPSRLSGISGADRLVDAAEPVWRPVVSEVLSALGLKFQEVRRLSWASTELETELEIWAEQTVVVLQLASDCDTSGLQALGEAVDLHLAGAQCRCLKGTAWPHPFAVVDPHTVVTGPAELLAELAVRSKPHLASVPIDRLLKVVSPDEDVLLLVDLVAARRTRWRLPTAVLDVWPAGRQAWRTIWEVPQGLGVSLRLQQRPSSRLALVCDGQTAAESVHSALDELIPAARDVLAERAASLSGDVQAGRIKADAANRYEVLLRRGLAGLQAARWEIVDETVWMRTAWDKGLAEAALAALDTPQAVQNDWLAAARSVDEANHRRLLSGLGGYQRAEGHFPPGAVGGALLPPQTRLSWIATMLPYYGHRQWHSRLEFGYSWNSTKNRAVARQPLPAVINPALWPTKTEAGFPVTHYVGVAGIGPDAGELAADDPRAGVFGFGRTTAPAEIADGASNTIAILGVTGRLGPWAAGGSPTVRGLGKPPYVDGPDGFGSAQPDGMLAGMADGSVRFISRDVDPRVLEQLATINGGGDVTIAALDTKPSPAKPEVPRPRSDASQHKPKQPEKPAAETEKPQQKHQPRHPAAGPEQTPIGPSKPDVKARLADRIPQVDFRHVPLAEVVEFLADLSTLQITFDMEAMGQLGVAPDDPVTVQLRQATVGRILQEVLSGRGLAYVVEKDQVLVTSPQKQRTTLRRVRYTVSDLAGAETSLAELSEAVRKLVAPESWHGSGGQGTLRAEAGAMFVTQIDPVHHRIITFCEKLRTARGKPLRSRLDPQRFTLVTRFGRAAERLDRPVTANFHDPTPLVRIVSYLEKAAGTNILIDWLALRTAGMGLETTGTLKAQEEPLGEALASLLEPLELSCLAIDANTLQVTTQKTAAARLELEFYPVRDLLTPELTPEALMERIKDQLAGQTWGESGGPGVIHFDRPSGCLLVLQSQPVHVDLERLLDQWRAEAKKDQ